MTVIKNSKPIGEVFTIKKSSLLPLALTSILIPIATCSIFDLIVPIKYDVVRARNESQLRYFADHQQYAVLDFIGLVERHGYNAEEHYVTTRDGYNLVLHRITGRRSLNDKTTNKPVVFVQHGLTLSSDSFVLIGPGKDLVFLLADAGYDVWLGNARGNTYSRSHVTLSPNDKNFWAYSYHEIGLFDMSASIDYVLFTTKQKTLTCIGYSMGAPELLVILSTLPEYNSKVKLVVFLAPVVIWRHKLPLVMRIYGKIRKIIQKIVNRLNFYEWLPQSSYVGKFAYRWCREGTIFSWLSTCSMIMSKTANIKTFNTSAYPTIFAHWPAGISYQSVEHYWQNVVTKNFQAYDHGIDKNQILYSSSVPPIYNLSQVTAPVAMYYGNNDFFATNEDQKILRDLLPNVVMFRKIRDDDFNHLDVMWSTRAKEILYDEVLAMMEKYRNTVTICAKMT